MGIGREVADAYIDVHGDLSSFRRDLDKGAAEAEKAAKRNAQDFGKAWGDEVANRVNDRWSSIVKTLGSNEKFDWDQLIGKFDPQNIDDAQSKMNEFMLSMRRHGKFTADEYKATKKAVNDYIQTVKDQQAAEDSAATAREDHARRLVSLQQHVIDMQDKFNRAQSVRADIEAEANRDNEAWMARRAKTMSEAIAENERWARTFEGISKNTAIKDLNEDFRRLTDAMVHNDIHGFAKSFDEDWLKLRTRVMEVTDSMVQQRRMTEENRRSIHDAVDEHIRMEEALRQATARTTTEVANAKIAQDRYNKSLQGMIESSHVKRLETDFRNLADAMDSGNWDRIAKGHRDMDSMHASVMRTANEMRNLGRLTDAEFNNISTRVRSAASSMGDFGRAANNSRDDVNGLHNAMTRLGNIFTKVSDATRGFRQHLGGFAGLNVFGDMIEEGLNFIHNLDRIAVSASLTTMKLATMASVAVSGMAEMVAIAGDLGGIIGGLGVLAPAFLVGAGIGIGVLVAAFKDMKKVLADLKPAFKALQDNISASFWKQAAGPIREAVKALMPLIDAKTTDTAKALGGLVGKLATAFKNIPAEKIGTMFDRMNRAIDILGNAMAPLIRAFTNLGDAGSKTFERFATWIVKISDQFDKFIQKSVDNGDLDKWIDNAIEGMKNLGRAIDGAMGIFNAINTAAEKAGFGGLKTFADALQRAADKMQSIAFQRTLTTYLLGMKDVVDKVAKAIGDLGPAFTSFAPTAQIALGHVGDAVSRIIGYIGQIFDNPTFQKGVRDFTRGLDDAVRKLEPAIKPFADSLGNALTILGLIAGSVADVVTAFSVTLGPVLDDMSRKLQELITPLRDGMVKAIQDLKPAFDAINEFVVGPLVTFIKDKLIPALTGKDGLIEQIGKVVVALAPVVGKFITEVLPPLLDLLVLLLPYIVALVKVLTPAVGDAFTQIGKGLRAMADGMKAFNEWAGPGLDFINRVYDALKKLDGYKPDSGNPFLDFATKIGVAIAQSSGLALGISIFFQKLTGNWFTGWSTFIRDIEGLGNTLGGAIATITDPAKLSVFIGQTVANMRTFGVAALEGFMAGLSTLAQRMVAPFIQGWTNIRNFFGIHSPSTLMLEMAMDVVQGFINGFTDLGTRIGEAWGAAVTAVTTKVEEIKTNLGLFFTDVQTNWDLFWGGLGTTIQTKWTEFTTWISTSTEQIKTNLGQFGTDVQTNWDTFWTGVGTTITTKWTEFTTWISTKTEEIKTNLTQFGTDVTNNWNTFWTGVGTTISTKWEEFKSTVSTKFGEIKNNIDNFAGQVKTNWDNFWAGVGSTVSTKWGEFSSTVTTKYTEIKNNIDGFIRDVKTNWDNFWAGLGTTITNAFSGVDLWTQGWSIIQGFWSGLLSAWGQVTEWIGGIANWIAENKGPLEYDRKLLVPAGKAIMQGLGAGLRSEMDPLLNTLQTITAAVTDTVTADLSKSVMYATGKDAAQGLADGLKANRTSVHTALGNLGAFTVPSSQIAVGGAFGSAVGRPTADVGPSRSLTIAEGAIRIETPTKSPELVAAKVIDSFVHYSTF